MAFRASDPEAQDCVRSTIPGPLPSLLPSPPPAYCTYPPIPPIGGSDPGPPEAANDRAVDRDGHYLRVIAIVFAVILIIALFAIAVFFTFVNHQKV